MFGSEDINIGIKNDVKVDVSQEIYDLINSEEYEKNFILSLAFNNKVFTTRFVGNPDFGFVQEFLELINVNEKDAHEILDYVSWPELYSNLFKLSEIEVILGSKKHTSIKKLLDAGIENWGTVFPLSTIESKNISDYRNYRDAELVSKSGLFDSIWYLNNYDDVMLSGMDPIIHYLEFGHLEGRDPSSVFDSKDYLDKNRDVAELNSNPLVHWIKYGRLEKRSTPFRLSREPIPDVDISDRSIMLEIEKIIRLSGCFSDKYYTTSYPDVVKANVDPLRHYIDHGWMENRNPCAEFDTWFYNTAYPQHARGPAGGFLHYVQFGKSQGLSGRNSNAITIDPNLESTVPSRVDATGTRIAIHLHLFYSDLIEEFYAVFNSINFTFDLYVTVCHESDVGFVKTVLGKLRSIRAIKVDIVPNRGRDLGPFINFLSEYATNYDFVCHLHSKKSKHAAFGDAWRHWILDSMFSTPGIPDLYLIHMIEHPNVGSMYSDNYFKIKQFIKADDNEKYFPAFCERLGISPFEIPPIRQFAAGSMMWLRVSAIRKLIDANFNFEEFEEENNQIDLTLAHMLERAFPLIVQTSGFINVPVYLSSRTTLRYDTFYRSAIYQDKTTHKWARDKVDIALNVALSLNPINKLFCPDRINISWVIPDFGHGAGGHMTIFRMIEQLDLRGDRQTIWIQNCLNFSTPLDAKQFIQKNYRKISDQVIVRFLPEDIRQLSGDAIIATDLWTVFPVRQAQNFKARYYFIQDYEPMFYPMGENYLIAESTYSPDLMALCAGTWLTKKAGLHGMWARCWDLASDPEFYFLSQQPRNSGPIIRIAFYCRSYTPRRATALGLAAFSELRNRKLNFELFLFGEEPRERNIAGPIKDLGILQPSELGELYRSCDIGVVFSTTNYSLVPLEMMACGLPVVEVDTESSRTAFPEGTVAYAKPTPIDVAECIERLIKDETSRTEQSRFAHDFVSQLDWVKSGKLLRKYLIEGILEKKCEPINPDVVCKSTIIYRNRAAVIIPTYNGGELFKQVLASVLKQKCDFEFEVVVVDSGSSDGTLEFAKSVSSRVRCEQINKNDFQHGRTRNYAISLTDSEYVAVLTQDALPANTDWLTNLLTGFEKSDRIAGVIGRHIAYPEHNQFVRRDLDAMFNKFSDIASVYSLDRMLPSFIYHGGLEDNMIKHFYSDNNSALRRSVWNELPYPNIDWGEDQVWCWEMLKLGFEKAYVDSAAVYHSHAINSDKDIDVSVEEGIMFGKYFGIELGSSNDKFTAPHELIVELRNYSLKKKISSEEIDNYISYYIRSNIYRYKGYLNSLK